MNPETVLVDTSIWIEYLRGTNESVRKRLAALVSADKAATADIIIMEILRGARSDREYDVLREDFLALPRIEMTGAVWEKAWRTGYELRRKGVHIPLTDTIIAGLALEWSCTLMHSDKHFDLIARHTDLKILHTEDRPFA
jgi:predicted nucleic acid-binding protein